MMYGMYDSMSEYFKNGRTAGFVKSVPALYFGTNNWTKFGFKFTVFQRSTLSLFSIQDFLRCGDK